MKFFLADVNHRRCSLLRAAILGVLSAFFIYYFFFGLKHDILRSSITILFLGLPTFYVLWVFRTHDVQKQIDKTEEGTNNSTFFECVRMLTEGEPIPKMPKGVEDYNLIKHKSLPKKTALEQLAYIRKNGFDKKRIDSLTRGLYLENENFESARFSGLDLSTTNLNGANLRGADLTKVKFNLEAILKDFKLYGAIYDDDTEFNGTILEKKETRGLACMIYKENEPA